MSEGEDIDPNELLNKRKKLRKIKTDEEKRKS